MQLLSLIWSVCMWGCPCLFVFMCMELGFFRCIAPTLFNMWYIFSTVFLFYSLIVFYFIIIFHVLIICSLFKKSVIFLLSCCFYNFSLCVAVVARKVPGLELIFVVHVICVSGHFCWEFLFLSALACYFGGYWRDAWRLTIFLVITKIFLVACRVGTQFF